MGTRDLITHSPYFFILKIFLTIKSLSVWAAAKSYSYATEVRGASRAATPRASGPSSHPAGKRDGRNPTDWLQQRASGSSLIRQEPAGSGAARADGGPALGRKPSASAGRRLPVPTVCSYSEPVRRLFKECAGGICGLWLVPTPNGSCHSSC